MIFLLFSFVESFRGTPAPADIPNLISQAVSKAVSDAITKAVSGAVAKKAVSAAVSETVAATVSELCGCFHCCLGSGQNRKRGAEFPP